MTKISELPEGVRQLAERERENRDLKLYPEESDLISRAFQWKVTKDGSDFWYEINQGNFQPYYDRYPVYKPLIEMASDRAACERVWEAVTKEAKPPRILTYVDYLELKGHYFQIVIRADGVISCEYKRSSLGFNPFTLVSLLHELGYSNVDQNKPK